jgi:predicted acyl esterase
MIYPSREQYDQIFQQIDALSIWRPAVGPKAKFPAFDPTHRYHNDLDLDIEYNHDIPMRDGIKLRGNIFRPAGSRDSKLPVLLSITPYGKDNPFDIGHFKQSKDFDAGIDGVYRSKYYAFEASDPVFWCRYGFAVVHADSRGSYASEGDRLSFLTKADGLDGHDAIEYFGNQPWTNGRVAMYGASALSVVQWSIPKHLWEYIQC